MCKYGWSQTICKYYLHSVNHNRLKLWLVRWWQVFLWGELFNHLMFPFVLQQYWFMIDVHIRYLIITMFVTLAIEYISMKPLVYILRKHNIIQPTDLPINNITQ